VSVDVDGKRESAVDFPIDVLILSGARPGLLERTLASFEHNLFRHFSIGRVFANVDPFGGTAKERDRCVEIVRIVFPGAELRIPDSPHFTDAVRWLWTQVKAPWAFHLEDDWLLNERIDPPRISPLAEGMTRQISLNSKQKNWRFHGDPFYHRVVEKKLWKWVYHREKVQSRPAFTTSPTFVERDFARHCSALMSRDLDPEKQLQDGRNPALAEFTSSYRNYLLGHEGRIVVQDIGRAHRKKIGLRKKVIEGRSIWIDEKA
jgi:hypothetical protein